jgi:hypothetical protein
VTARTDVVRDTIALITGCLEDAEPGLDEVLDEVLADLVDAKPLEIAVAFAAVVVHMLDTISLATGRERKGLWQLYTAVEARRNEGGHHG